MTVQHLRIAIVMASEVLKRRERGTAGMRKHATLVIPQKLE